MSEVIFRKQQAVNRLLKAFGRVVIAFSGGVDSTLLAKLARDGLGKENALVVTADSPSFSRADLQEAEHLAQALDLNHRVIQTEEVELPEYQANTPARCYFCKRTLFEALEGLARREAFYAVCYGVLADDRLAQRPGHRAAQEHAVSAPLQEAGFTKAEVRRLARMVGLSNWDKPQNACLSSRIPHGMAVTGEKLAQIEQAELILKASGFRQVRVRHLGEHARIEVEASEVFHFNDPALCVRITRSFEKLGFKTVGINRSGYREGGADLALVDEVLLTAIGKCCVGGVAQLVRAGES